MHNIYIYIYILVLELTSMIYCDGGSGDGGSGVVMAVLMVVKEGGSTDQLVKKRPRLGTSLQE
jgi:hypothetical protein